MPAYAITGARLIDGSGEQPIDTAALVIRGDRIAAVGPAGDVEIPDDARVIDGSGMTVLPGLIDAHMHVGFGFTPVRKLQDSLSRGVTTVATVTGGPEAPKLREAIEGDVIRGCARYHCGAVVGCTYGHLHREDENVAGVDADGPWEVRRGVRQMVQAGADFIKTAASGGFQWAAESLTWRNYTLEELTALVDEAHAWGRRVSVHAHAQPGINTAIAAGCDMIHHGSYLDDDGLERLAASGVVLVPTLYITSERSFSRESLPEHITERMKQAHEPHREAVRRAHRLGITIAVGTDGGPGDAAYELQELVACGMTPMEAILAGTRLTAQALGLEHRIGTLEPGKQADVLMVRGDPLEDIAILEDQEAIALVLCDGKPPWGPAVVGQASPSIAESGGYS